MIVRREKNNQEKNKENGNVAVASDRYDSTEVLDATSETSDNRVLDSGCSFHMCPKKNGFMT